MTIESINESLKAYGIDLMNGWNVPGIEHSNISEMTEREKDVIYKYLYDISKTVAEFADNL